VWHRRRAWLATVAGLPLVQIVGCTGADLLDAAQLELSRAAGNFVFSSALTVAQNLLDV
jgi:hypothetical protein